MTPLVETELLLFKLSLHKKDDAAAMSSPLLILTCASLILVKCLELLWHAKLKSRGMSYDHSVYCL